jgi:hypothetical protein
LGDNISYSRSTPALGDNLSSKTDDSYHGDKRDDSYHGDKRDPQINAYLNLETPLTPTSHRHKKTVSFAQDLEVRIHFKC